MFHPRIETQLLYHPIGTLLRRQKAYTGQVYRLHFLWNHDYFNWFDPNISAIPGNVSFPSRIGVFSVGPYSSDFQIFD
jgi:hypothetical protein